MNAALVGYTGFVGGNLAASHAFDALYNSKNIANAYATHPDLLIYAGLPAAKYLANTAPEKDAAVCREAFETMQRIAPKKLVLISTVDVYAAPSGVTENDAPETNHPQAYGLNRAQLEQMVRGSFPDALIIRLPALFGAGLKKNFLYDFLYLVPAMLKNDVFEALAQENDLIKQSYVPGDNGFWALCKEADQKALRAFFASHKSNALSFTDSRAQYQFYDLHWLWKDISWALAANLPLLNIATQPLTAAEIYETLTHGKVFENHLKAPVAAYNMRSKYDTLYEGVDGYLYSKDEVLDAIRSFVAAVRKQL